MFSHMTYLNDLNLRHPQIQDSLYPAISIIFTNKAEQYLKHVKSNMVISITDDLDRSGDLEQKTGEIRAIPRLLV